MMRPREIIDVLHRSEQSGSQLVPLTALSIRRVHRNDRGNITVLFIMLGLLFYAGAAMVWNTGHTTSAQTHVQVAADTSAYSAAVWMSRGVNSITGANMLITRNASADVIAFGVIWTTIMVPINWAKFIDDTGKACTVAYAICAGVAAAYVAAVELPPYLNFVSKALPTALQTFPARTFQNRIRDLYNYQRGWVDAIPTTIEKQRDHFEKYYKSTIRYTQPGRSDGKVHLPVEQGTMLSLMAPLALRFYLMDNKWPKDSGFKQIKEGKAVREWNTSTGLWLLVSIVMYGSQHHVLTTQNTILEFGPDSLSSRQNFSVLATVAEAKASQGILMMPGIFRHPISPQDTVIGLAQAETYSGISERVTLLFNVPYPFRVWTTWGWQWQPRLTRLDQLQNAMQGDSTMRNHLNKIGVGSSSYGDFNDMVRH